MNPSLDTTGEAEQPNLKSLSVRNILLKRKILASCKDFFLLHKNAFPQPKKTNLKDGPVALFQIDLIIGLFQKSQVLSSLRKEPVHLVFIGDISGDPL